jgi:hypothetical protein
MTAFLITFLIIFIASYGFTWLIHSLNDAEMPKILFIIIFSITSALFAAMLLKPMTDTVEQPVQKMHDTVYIYDTIIVNKIEEDKGWKE